jgi:hypothetical protein
MTTGEWDHQPRPHNPHVACSTQYRTKGTMREPRWKALHYLSFPTPTQPVVQSPLSHWEVRKFTDIILQDVWLCGKQTGPSSWRWISAG